MSEAHQDQERDAHGGGRPVRPGRGWEPVPQGDGYDGDATAFVQLPPEFMLEGTPLEAPGHGYVPPPMIVPLTPAAATDPGATGAWTMPPVDEAPEAYEAPEASVLPEAVPGAQAPDVPDVYEAASAATGQWTIPTVEDAAEALDDSGEYTAARLARYASSAPATLPGGAPAPWAVTEPVAAEHRQAPAPELGPGLGPEAVSEAEGEPGLVPEREPEEGVALADVPAGHDAADALDVHPDVHEGPDEHAAHAAHDVSDTSGASGASGIQAEADALIASGMSVDSDEHPTSAYTLRVNGVDRPVTDSWIGESLLYVLRERLGLAGAKDGCSQGECGACNVQVDGRLVASCLVPAATAAGAEVRTVEGLAVDGEPSDVQRALAKCGVQCGFCIPGMAMTVHDLLEGNHAPTELETRQALCGNLCRCSGYRGVLDAVREIVTAREGGAAGSGAGAASVAGADFLGHSAPAPAPAHGHGPAPDDAGGAARIPHQIPHPHDGGTA
ncbi:2Fe-2S iron-sulfur cluster-binding protein [Streptomyces sp. NPDC090025]|uniref:2Fe-2S iron-sulfur cluster-binding protein n=1 Tax=Streptomyces sp. NPDC090025 TaxID=3365922 RepID=UPI003836D7D2